MNSRVALAVVILALPLACSAQSATATSSSGVSDQASPSAQSPSDLHPESDEIVGGHLIYREDPKYPKEVRKQRLQGQVLVQATVEENGTVSIVTLVSGDPTLADAALKVVHKWRFEPFTQNGHRVRVQQKMVFDFAPSSKVAELQLPLPKPKYIPLFDGPGVYRVGGAISPPQALYTLDPEYSDDARRAKFEGVCVLSVIVGTDGLPRDIKVYRSLGMGLDEKAIEAVKQWRFEPAKKDGKPVSVAINIEINFRL